MIDAMTISAHTAVVRPRPLRSLRPALAVSVIPVPPDQPSDRPRRADLATLSGVDGGLASPLAGGSPVSSPRPGDAAGRSRPHGGGSNTTLSGGFSMVVATWGVGQVLWSMIWFFLFFLWIWLAITVFVDIFRSQDLGGWAKAAWTAFVVFVPMVGVLAYLIARGHKMAEHAVQRVEAQDAAARVY